MRHKAFKQKRIWPQCHALFPVVHCELLWGHVSSTIRYILEDDRKRTLSLTGIHLSQEKCGGNKINNWQNIKRSGCILIQTKCIETRYMWSKLSFKSQWFEHFTGLKQKEKENETDILILLDQNHVLSQYFEGPKFTLKERKAQSL